MISFGLVLTVVFMGINTHLCFAPDGTLGSDILTYSTPGGLRVLKLPPIPETSAVFPVHSQERS